MRNDLTHFADTLNIGEVGHAVTAMPTLATPATTATTATTAIFGFTDSNPVTVSAEVAPYGSVNELIRARESALQPNGTQLTLQGGGGPR
ncbi:hypothetical protein FHX35_001773 [Auritidibacter ignavus]|nr:hypothetical protein [Auritidibacter ignavus]